MIGTPLAYLVNATARILGFMLRIDHSLDREFKTIVVCKYAGLGSIIQSTPLIQTLRKNFPGSRLVFVSTKANGTLLKHIPEIDEMLLVSDKSLWQVAISSLQLLKQLWLLKPDLYIDLEFYSNYSGIIATLSKATNRLGFYNDDKHYRKGIYNYLVHFDANIPISETYLQFALLVNSEHIVKELKLSLPEDIDEGPVLKKLGIEKQKYIVINPNASDLRLERRWPKEYFAEIIRSLLKDYPEYKIVLIGNRVESEYVKELLNLIAPHPSLTDSSGKLDLPELILLINGASLMLTNDTGPMHMAYALNIKTISLFGPCSPQQYGQYTNGVTFYKQVHCSPCVHIHLVPPCHGNNICMKNIFVNEVILALSENLN